MGRRRFLLTSLAGALAAPLGVEAQQEGKAHKLGFLAFSPADASLDGAFRRGLREPGYIEGRRPSASRFRRRCWRGRIT
jgi:hypothetical protein